MKKYIKPELFYEPYQLSVHVADCGWELQSGDPNTCVAFSDQSKWGIVDTLFTSRINCNNKADTGGFQLYCYENGSDGLKVFKS